MTIYPRFQVMLVQVNAASVVSFKNKSVIISQQVMIKHHNRCPGFYMGKVVFQPKINILTGITGSMVTACHRSDNIMHTSGVKRIINRTVDIFKKLFAVFTFDKVMVSDTIEDRAVHILRIHQFDMLFQPFLITDIAGMNDKSGMLIRCIVTYIIYPFIMILGIENLCIGNMDIFMGAILTQTSVIRHQPKVVRSLLIFYFMIMAVISLIAGRSSNKNKTFPGMTGKRKTTVSSCFHNIQSVRNLDAGHRFLSLIKHTVLILVYINMSGVCCHYRKRSNQQAGN